MPVVELHTHTPRLNTLPTTMLLHPCHYLGCFFSTGLQTSSVPVSASGRQTTTTDKAAPSREEVQPPTVPSDQASLKDCPVVIHTDTMWGTATETVPELSTEDGAASPALPASSAPSSTQSPATLDPGRNQQAAFLSPDQIHQIVAATVQQSLASQFRPSCRARSVSSGFSASCSEVCCEKPLKVGAPVSPASSTGSHVSSSAEMDLQDFDLSEDEGLPPEQPAFTGLFPQALFKAVVV